MDSPRLRAFFCLLLSLFSLLPVFSSDSDLQDSEQSGAWVYGISLFEGKNLSPTYVYLTRSIPLGLAASLRGLPRRSLSEEELRVRGESAAEKLRAEKRKELAGLLAKRDEFFFAGDPDGKKRTDLDKQIRELEAFFNDPGSAKESGFPAGFSETIPVSLAKENAGGILLDAKDLSVWDAAESFGVDLLFSGLVEEVEGFLYLEVTASHRALRRSLPVYRKGFTAGNLSAVIDELTQAAARVVLGREYASLTVSASPQKASIFIDGENLGSGNVSVPYLSPGAHELLVRAERHEDRLMSVSLASGESRLIEVSLVPRRGLLALTTYPQGADVYVSSEWRGRTPLFLEDPMESDLIRIQKENYQDVIFNPGTSSDLRITLVPDRNDTDANLKKRRNAFYRSFGIFALSVPVPFFAYGLSSDYARAYSRSTGPDQERLYNISMGMYSAYIGGLIISGSLFIDTAVKLIDYIRTAENAR